MKNTFLAYLDNMILSASGWRTVFAASQDEEDKTCSVTEEHMALATLASLAFAQYMKEKSSKNPCIVVGMDSRPTGSTLAEPMIKALVSEGIDVRYVGIIAAPEIMAYANNTDGFVYISASHNPVGHNGIKFGFSDGGVIPASEAKILISKFRELCATENPEIDAKNILDSISSETMNAIYAKKDEYKTESYNYYKNFSKQVISGETDSAKQDALFSAIAESTKTNSLTIVCDMNGSARCLTIDKEFITSMGLKHSSFNDIVGNIVHAIIPEGKNLQHCADKMEELHANSVNDALLGYLPDCDGDRGNIVFWNTKTQKAEILQAQEVFALSVLSEFAYSLYRSDEDCSLGVAINCSTSMRIEEIAAAFNATAFRAEVGEANVVNCAREQRANGYTVPILGEGSNGGNITHPAAVRDPINTLFALVKLLVLRSTDSKPGLFEIWCKKSNQMDSYKADFSLIDIIETLPQYVTTGVSEERALLKVKTRDNVQLKKNFQKAFIAGWETKKDYLAEKFGFARWEAAATVGTKETKGIEDFGVSGTGGLKIRFMNTDNDAIACMWMRGSGTEPIFRVMVDMKAQTVEAEKELIAWETELLEIADNM